MDLTLKNCWHWIEVFPSSKAEIKDKLSANLAVQVLWSAIFIWYISTNWTFIKMPWEKQGQM